MRLVFAGTPDVALPALTALAGSARHQVVAVVTRPDAPRGRGRTRHPSPVAARAAELGCEILRPTKPGDADFVARLREIAPDCCPVVAYGGLLPQRVLDIPRYGWVNLHFSLLPAWRGAAPVQRAIMAGDEVTGASTFGIVAELDAGPVYGTVTEAIGPTTTAGELLTRLSKTGAGLLGDTMDQIEAGLLAPIPQPAEGITLAPKITVENARIDWQQPAVVIDRLVRGCAPAPGGWTTFRGQRLKINSCTPQPGQGLAPGELAVSKHSVAVGTGDERLVLEVIQPQGKKPMPAADWARGVEFSSGERLGQ